MSMAMAGHMILSRAIEEKEIEGVIFKLTNLPKSTFKGIS